jgi:hypothetical protein
MKRFIISLLFSITLVTQAQTSPLEQKTRLMHAVQLNESTNAAISNAVENKSKVTTPVKKTTRFTRIRNLIYIAINLASSALLAIVKKDFSELVELSQESNKKLPPELQNALRFLNLSLYSHLTVTALNIAAVASGNNFYYLPDIATAILTFNTWVVGPK